MKRTALLLVVALLAGCDKPKPPEPTPAPAASSAAPRSVGTLGGTRPAPERVVAIGDIHGDLDAARRALRLAGAIDDKDAWIGGKLVVVQTGDQIDRGDEDRKVLDLFERLKGEATKTGGEVLSLVGNHEVMNAQLDFRYVTRPAFGTFADVNPKDEAIAQGATRVDPPERGRASAFLPGGPYATMLAKRPVIARVGDSIFVHGGVLPKHVRSGLDEINEGTQKWLLGERRLLPKEATSEDGPLWSRMYSSAPSASECAELDAVLNQLGAKRMVMGHTPQKPDISPACDGKAWRIDTGMSKYYAGQVQVLELRGNDVKVLKERR